MTIKRATATGKFCTQINFSPDKNTVCAVAMEHFEFMTRCNTENFCTTTVTL